MSHGLYIERADGTASLVPSWFRWPRGDAPHRGTVRARLYFHHYWLPRIVLWVCVVLPPVVVFRLLWSWSFDEWTLAQRLVVDATVLGLACAVAAWIDAMLNREVFDGQASDPHSPCLRRAASLTYAWRTHWAEFEANPVGSRSPRFSGSLRFMLPCASTETFDLSALVQQQGVQILRSVASEAGRQLERTHPGTISRAIGYNERMSHVVVAPCAAEPQTPESATAHVWMVASEPDTSYPGAVLRLGQSFWFPGGKVSDGTTRVDDATVTIKRVSWFGGGEGRLGEEDRGGASLGAASLMTLFVWPLGVLLLIAHGLYEKRHHERYRSFVARHSPAYGDSLDLWLIQTIRVRFPGWFPRTPDAFTKDAQRLSVQFRQVFAAMSASGSGGVGGVR